jgi:RNA polymerase sigma-70 factor (ECF subfamily)
MDRLAIEKLYVTYGPMVVRRARRFLGNEHAAADAAQDVFLRVVRHSGQFRGAASPTTWLFQVTTNHCLNVLRDRNRRTELWSQWQPTGSDVAAGGTETRLMIAQILERIAPELREIAVYHLVDGLSRAEIANVLGVSPRTVGYRLEAFREQVRDQLVTEAK